MTPGPNAVATRGVRRALPADGPWLAGYVAFLAVFAIAPFLLVVVLSFTDALLGDAAAHFVGLRNYRDLFEDPLFRGALVNTLAYTGLTVGGAVGLGLICALLLDSAGWARPLYETVYFLPAMASSVAMLLVWEFMLHPDLGLVNQGLQAAGWSPPAWLNDPDTALLTLSVIGVWQLFGLNVLLFVAALSAMPRSVFEAAAIDGVASPLDRSMRMTLPLLSPTIAFVSILTAVRSVQVFESVQVLTQGGPGNATNVILYQMYEEGFEFLEAGRASAVAVVFLLLTALAGILKSVRLRGSARWS